MEEKMIKAYDKPVVIQPSFEILSDDLSVSQRIEICGRVCYKSEDKITNESAVGFAGKMAEHKHNSTIEMAVVSYDVLCEEVYILQQFYETLPKYLVVETIDGGCGAVRLLITGSVRAFREMAMRHPDCLIISAIAGKMEKSHPHFFKDINIVKPSFIELVKVPLEDIDQLHPESQARHRYVGVRFFVNRAVTHELVRHRPCNLLQESQRYCRYSKDQFGNRVTFIKPMFFKEGSEDYRLWEESMLYTEARYFELLKNNTPQAARTVLPNSCKTELIIYTSLEHWHHIFHMRAINPGAEPSMREIMIPIHEEFIRRFPSQNFGEPLRMPEGWVSK